MNTQSGAATILAEQIRSAARQVSGRLSDKALDSRRTGITSDDISQAMMSFLREDQDLRKMPDSTVIAFDLVMNLAGYSYGDSGSSGSGYDDRPSDEVVDDLLCELAVERRRGDPSWDFGEQLQLIRKRDQYLSPHGISDFCAGTEQLLSEWQDGITTLEDVSKEIEKAVSDHAGTKESQLIRKQGSEMIDDTTDVYIPRRRTQTERRGMGRNKAKFAPTIRRQALARKESTRNRTASVSESDPDKVHWVEFKPQ